ncbi:MAG TPA: xanthine dehydrogenase family protein subunit M [Bryobacteraceae bacterium]|nr:xanthine dehydrogenase family protein subunit M [Bryobacteraceae bacterium]
MLNFEYASPSSLKEATALLGASWADAQVLAGGTDLISLMKDYIESPKRVVNIKNIKELGGISSSKGGLRIGALVTFDELAANAAVRTQFPSLASAVRGVTSPQIRNMGTVGGDLCQRPRCWYYRTGNGLLGMKDGKSLVPTGENRYHAIFGEGPAYFVSPSSLGPALIALGAKAKLVSTTGTREVDIAKFFVAPANDTSREIALAPNEILTEIVIPAAATKNATYEVREKDALDWPLATASVALKMKGDAVESAQVVLGHVAATPYVATQAAEMLAGKTITEDVAEAVGKAAVAGAKPLSDNAYKVQLAKVAVKRALLEAAGKKAV